MEGIILEENWIAIPFDVENIRERTFTRICNRTKELLKALIIRILGIIVAILGIVLLIPFSFVVMFQNAKNGDYGSVFKTEKRIGKNGKVFKMFRFRGTPGSEFEKILSSTYLDELPQFINILLGNMSLVGPRPYTLEDKKKMGTYYSYITRIKPGLTGVYQISGRTKMDLLDRLDMDTRYYYNKGFWIDFKILLITMLITLKRRNTISLVDYTYITIKEALTSILKRMIDIVGALVGITILLPLTVVVAIANFVSGDKGPIIYSHERIGRYGKHFKMYKFRSMVVDADAKLEELLANDEEARKEWEENRKLKNDPRITKIGRILRKTSLDEFPQFINVLKGEMSLVGPRAVIDGEIELFGENKTLVLSVKPGVTGYWAANGRSDTSYNERVEMESFYAKNLSIPLDIKILFKTVESVIKKEGAM